MLCRACGREKAPKEFSRHGDHRRSICRECDNAARRQRDFGISGIEFELLRRANNGLCWCCGKRPAAVLDHEHGEEDQHSRRALSKLQSRDRAARRRHSGS